MMLLEGERGTECTAFQFRVLPNGNSQHLERGVDGRYLEAARDQIGCIATGTASDLEHSPLRR